MTETPRQQRITLCGSTRFKKAWMEWNARLTLQGHVVYSVAMWSHNVRVEPTEEQKKLLDQVHLAKIDNSDEVFVLDVGGYIGESTKREIAHAEATGKRVHYLSQTYPDWTEDDCLWAQEPDVEDPPTEEVCSICGVSAVECPVTKTHRVWTFENGVRMEHCEDNQGEYLCIGVKSRQMWVAPLDEMRSALDLISKSGGCEAGQPPTEVLHTMGKPLMVNGPPYCGTHMKPEPCPDCEPGAEMNRLAAKIQGEMDSEGVDQEAVDKVMSELPLAKRTSEEAGIDYPYPEDYEGKPVELELPPEPSSDEVDRLLAEGNEAARQEHERVEPMRSRAKPRRVMSGADLLNTALGGEELCTTDGEVILPKRLLQVGQNIKFDSLPGEGKMLLRCCACGHKFKCDPDKSLNCRVTADYKAYPRCPACGVGG